MKAISSPVVFITTPPVSLPSDLISYALGNKIKKSENHVNLLIVGLLQVYGIIFVSLLFTTLELKGETRVQNNVHHNLR
jgi:hypothetical protein